MLTRVNEQVALDQLFDRMKAEPPAETVARGKTTFDNLAGPFADQLVLFGAGPLGKLTLQRLRGGGLEPLAFSDNNAALWGTRVEGLEVLSPADARRRFGSHAI